MPPRSLDPVLVLRRPEEQLIIDDRVFPDIQQMVDHVRLLPRRIGIPASACLLDALTVIFIEDHVLGLHVRHVVPFYAQVFEGLLLHGLQVMNDVGDLELDVLEELDEVLAPDPFINELVLFQNIEVDARMATRMRLILARERPLCQSCIL